MSDRAAPPRGSPSSTPVDRPSLERRGPPASPLSGRLSPPRHAPGDLREGLALGLESLDLGELLEDRIPVAPVARERAVLLGDQPEDRVVVDRLPRELGVVRDLADLPELPGRLHADLHAALPRQSFTLYES